jgi:hypothetical protein
LLAGLGDIVWELGCCLTRHSGLGGAQKCAIIVVVEGRSRSF